MTEILRALLLVVFGFAAVGAELATALAFLLVSPFVLVISASLFMISLLD